MSTRERHITTKLQTRRSVVTDPRQVAKVGRNEPCPCGSGKKFKACHAAQGEEYLQKLAQERAFAADATQPAGTRRSWIRRLLGV